MYSLHILYVPWPKKTEKPYQDTKPGSNDELAAIWLEGKIINTEKESNGETVIQLINLLIHCLSCKSFLKKR